ncbi:Hypothetical protein LUCI_0682 [Lucifera butyrica]|uniref:Uncharacterized protein n=1 Tax=Lucifera butyrica TaxID=1351585 RepID=A0A498R5E3_9FIRM|nr:Hypothetical protein LUCI_0682 [Lucifera butyrica]
MTADYEKWERMSFPFPVNLTHVIYISNQEAKYSHEYS